VEVSFVLFQRDVLLGAGSVGKGGIICAKKERCELDNAFIRFREDVWE